MVVVDEARAGGGQRVLAAELLPGPFELLVAELARARHAGEPEVRRLREDRGVEQAGMSADRRRLPVNGTRWSVKPVQPSTSISSSGRSTSGRRGSTNFRSRASSAPRSAVIEDELAIGELRLSGGVALAREPLEQLVLLAGERVEALGAVERAARPPGRTSPADLLPLLVGQQQGRRVGVPAAARHPDPAGAQRGAQLVGGAQLISAAIEAAAACVDDVGAPLRVDERARREAGSQRRLSSTS